MSVEGVSGMAVAATGAGAILIWSGIKGASVSKTLASVVSGQQPSASTANAITASYDSSQSSTGGTSTASSSPADLGGATGSGAQNELTVARFLRANGYSRAAAAGIASCIEGESAGNPATPGGGLIQILSGNPGYTTNTSLAAQEQSIITYNNAQGAALIQQLNAISDPVQAADFYSQRFERPAVTNSDVRPSVATSIYSQLG